MNFVIRLIATAALVATLFGCQAGGARQMSGSEDAVQTPPRTEEAGTRDLAASPVSFKVEKDGRSKRITWASSQPIGKDMQICFERGGETVLCNDVEEGERFGVVYAFGKMPIEACEAIFRPRSY